MEAVAPNGVFFAQFQGNGVQIGLGRHLSMEGGFERADHGGIGHQGLELPDGSNVGRSASAGM